METTLDQFEPWHEYALTIVGAAAALMGLLFVAASLDIEHIARDRGLRVRVAHALILLGTPMYVGLLMLVPTMTEQTLGLLILCWVLPVGFGLVLADWLVPVPKNRLRALMVRLGPCTLATLGLLISGGLLLRHENGLNWVVPGTMASFAGALLNAWNLLIEIHREDLPPGVHHNKE